LFITEVGSSQCVGGSGREQELPKVSAKIKAPVTADRKFDDMAQSAQLESEPIQRMFFFEPCIRTSSIHHQPIAPCPQLEVAQSIKA
jgi:hypothetical protein